MRNAGVYAIPPQPNLPTAQQSPADQKPTFRADQINVLLAAARRAPGFAMAFSH